MRSGLQLYRGDWVPREERYLRLGQFSATDENAAMGCLGEERGVEGAPFWCLASEESQQRGRETANANRKTKAKERRNKPGQPVKMGCHEVNFECNGRGCDFICIKGYLLRLFSFVYLYPLHALYI